MAKQKIHQRLGFRFRWKYAVSAFLVCGVLSLTIGGPGRPDPLLVEAQRIQQMGDRIFLINKDPATATNAELFGPTEKTFMHDSPVLIDFAAEVYRLGQKISRESFRRSAIPKNEIRGPEITAVASSVKIYGELQLRLYRNYMRLAHDAEFKTFRQPDLLASVIRRVFLGKFQSEMITLEKWVELNKDIVGVKGAREFSPRYYDSFNILIDSKTAQNLYTEEKSSQMYNLRHVKDENGNYTRVERFMTEQEKQMAEYLAIQNPKNKDEYMKLVQFSAIREALTNRWAIRRMAGANIEAETKKQTYRPMGYAAVAGLDGSSAFQSQTTEVVTGRFVPLTFSDEKINSCAEDLVSFRLRKKGTVNDLEAYSSLWQGDRQVDLMTFAVQEAAKATADQSLLTDPEYAELTGKFLSNFPHFQSVIIPAYKGKEDSLLKDLQADYAPNLKKIEESQWSSTPIEGPQTTPIVISEEAFHFSNFPADDLSVSAVADRYVDQAFKLRSYFLAEALWWIADQSTKQIPESAVAVSVDTTLDPYAVPFAGGSDAKTISAPAYPEMKKPESKVLAAKTVADFMASREKTWKARLKPIVVKALESKLGFSVPTANGNPAGIGYARNNDQARYDGYVESLKPIAAMGARGYQGEKAAERAIHVLDAAVPRFCPPTMGTGGSGGGGCYVNYPDPEKLSAKKRENVDLYIAESPFRKSARDAGMKNILIPETPDQLASFFRKKLQVTAEYSNTVTQSVKYKEQDVALKILNNPVVMRGIDQLFADVADTLKKDEGAAGQSDGSKLEDGCKKPLVMGAVQGAKGKGAKRAPSSNSDSCSMSETPATKAKWAALESAIIPAAKESYKKFIAGLSEKPKNMYPDRVVKAAEAERAKATKVVLDKDNKKIAEKARPVQDNIQATGRKFDLSKEKFGKPKTASQKKFVESVNAQKKAERDEISGKLAAKKKAAEDFEAKKKKNGYFRKGRSHAFDQEGGRFYLETAKERAEAKHLYREALGMLGISLDATRGVAGDEAKAERLTKGALPDRVHSWVMVEYLIKKKYAATRLLERMVITPIDQLAMGKVLMQEATARFPILTLQGTWKVERNWYGKEKEWKNDEEKRPNLLQKFGKIYSPKDGWGDGKAFDRVFKQTLSAAGKSDQGKVETFCKANLRYYRTDDNFRTMFSSVSGIRSALTRGADGEEDQIFKFWDDEIQKESRVWSAAFNEDYLDPYVTPIMIAMFCVIAFQLAFAFAPALVSLLGSYFAGGAASTGAAAAAAAGAAESAAVAGAAATAAGTTAGATVGATAASAETGLLTQAGKFLAKFIFVQMTGNLGIPGLIFTFQSFIMGHAYLYALPPQMGFTYQLANSQIQSMKGERVAGMTMVDRDRLAQAREELSGQGLMAEISLIGEVAQFGFFTAPGALKTFGITGQKALARTVAHATPEVADQFATKSLPGIIKEKGFKNGLKEYWKTKASQVFVKMERVSVVQGTERAKAGLSEALGARLAHDIPKKKLLREIYADALKAENEALAMLKTQAKNQIKDSGLDKVMMNQELERGLDQMIELRNRLKAEVDRLGDEAFGTVIITDEYQAVLSAFEKADKEMTRAMVSDERWWNGLFKGKFNKSDQTLAILKMAKVEDAERKIKLIEKLMKNLDEIPVKEGEAETLAFFEKLSPDDLAVHADFLRGKKRWGILGNRKGSAQLTREERKSVKSAYDDFAYLTQDWETASKWASSIKNAAHGMEADVVIGGKDGKLDKADFEENPDKYSVISVSSSQLGITPKKAKRIQERRRRNSN